MRTTSRLLWVLPWLTLTTSCLPFGAGTGATPDGGTESPDGGSSQRTVDAVKLIQRDEASTLFKAQLVDVRTGEVVLEAAGKGTQLDDFDTASGQYVLPQRAITLTLPLATTADVVVKPPKPPGPTGQDRIAINLALQVSAAYEDSLAQQVVALPAP